MGVAEKKDDGVDFAKRLNELSKEFEMLSDSAKISESTIIKNVKRILKEGGGIKWQD